MSTTNLRGFCCKVRNHLYDYIVELSYAERPSELVEGGSSKAIVIQPQDEEIGNLENEPDNNQLQNGEIEPSSDLHSNNTDESQYIVPHHEGDDNNKIVIQPQNEEMSNLGNDPTSNQRQNEEDNSLVIEPSRDLHTDNPDEFQSIVRHNKEDDSREIVTSIQSKNEEISDLENGPNRNRIQNEEESSLVIEPPSDLHTDSSYELYTPHNKEDDNMKIVIQPQNEEISDPEKEPDSNQLQDEQESSLVIEPSPDPHANEFQNAVENNMEINMDDNFEINSFPGSDTDIDSDQSKCPATKASHDASQTHSFRLVWSNGSTNVISAESDKVENESNDNQQQNEISSLAIEPSADVHRDESHVANEKEDVNMEIKPPPDLNKDTSQSPAEGNDVCTFRLAEFWTNGSTNVITAVYSPVNVPSVQIPNVQIEDTVVNNDTDYSTDSASENEDSCADINMASSEMENKVAPKISTESVAVTHSDQNDFTLNSEPSNAKKFKKNNMPPFLAPGSPGSQQSAPNWDIATSIGDASENYGISTENIAVTHTDLSDFTWSLHSYAKNLKKSNMPPSSAPEPERSPQCALYWGTDTPLGDASESDGTVSIKDEIPGDYSPWQNNPLYLEDITDSIFPKKKQLVIKLKDISKESKITFLEHKDQGAAYFNESGGGIKVKTFSRQTAIKCPDCEAWVIGDKKFKTLVFTVHNT